MFKIECDLSGDVINIERPRIDRYHISWAYVTTVTFSTEDPVMQELRLDDVRLFSFMSALRILMSKVHDGVPGHYTSRYDISIMSDGEVINVEDNNSGNALVVQLKTFLEVSKDWIESTVDNIERLTPEIKRNDRYAYTLRNTLPVMKHRHEYFSYYETTEQLPFSDNNTFIGSVSDGISDESSLLKELYRIMEFPGYFGFNWDALHECLRDFHWLSEQHVVIIHNDLSHLSIGDLGIYLDILYDSIITWDEVDSHKLEVYFPVNQKELLIKALRLE